VTSTGYGDLYAIDGPDKYFTSNFGGTSSASPIVTGAVILLQSVYKHVAGNYLSPAQVRTFLRSTGKAQTNGTYSAATFPIGPLPNVPAAIQAAVNSGSVAEHNASGSVGVAPNPSGGMFYFTFPGNARHVSVVICDATGREVFRHTTEHGGATIADLSGRAAGLYLARINCDDHMEIKKLVLAQ